MNNKLPTAKEFLLNYSMPENTKDVFYLDRFGVDFLIEFTKLHVKKALLEASEKSFAESSRSNITSRGNLTCIHLGEVSVNKDSILNAYPLENIK